MTMTTPEALHPLPEPEVHDAAGYRRAFTADQMHAYARAALAAPQPAQEPCRWTQEDEGSDTFWTDCNKGFTFTDGAPEDNGFPYCCYCGKPLTQVLWTEPADEDEPLPQPPKD